MLTLLGRIEEELLLAYRAIDAGDHCGAKLKLIQAQDSLHRTRRQFHEWLDNDGQNFITHVQQTVQRLMRKED